jgi:hypothetical protein
MKTLMGVIMLSLLALSCDETGTEQTGTLAAATDKTDYLVDETIRLEFRNGAGVDVLLASCCTDIAFYVDSWNNTAWHQVEARGLPCPMLCPSIEIVVASARTLPDSLSMQTEGTFRLRIPYAVRGHGSFDREVVTNSFTVRKE